MEEEEDDFYAPAGDAQPRSDESAINQDHTNGHSTAQDEDMDAQEEQDNGDQDDDEEEDDDDDSVRVVK